jgi:beta-carotene hydroxylase
MIQPWDYEQKAGHSRSNLREILALPTVAWGTIALALGIVSTFLGNIGLYMRGITPAYVAIPIGSLACYMAFTLLHDSAHRSVSKFQWINEVVGRIAGWILLCGPFVTFRYMHLEHHKHTNDPNGADPDYYSGTGTAWTRPLHWATQDLHYYFLYFFRPKGRPTAEVVEVFVELMLRSIVFVIAIAAGHGMTLVICWFIPVRIAIFFLAYTFDYLPHKPHKIKQSDDRFRATHMLTWAPLTPLFLFQNMHLIHHLYPGIPFYRYGKVWRAQKDFLLSKGALEIHPRNTWRKIMERLTSSRPSPTG